jgi:hypothetical protein
VNYERKQVKHGKTKHQPSIHTNKQIGLVSSTNNQQRTIEKEIKQIPKKKFAKFEEVSDQKQRCSREVNNNNHFKPMKAKQIISISKNNVSTKHTNINKQFLLKTNCSKKLSNLFKGIASNQNKKYLGQEKTIDRALTDNHSSFRPVKTGISRVTAQSDMQTSLFALNFCIKCFTKEKNPFTVPRLKLQSSLK